MGKARRENKQLGFEYFKVNYWSRSLGAASGLDQSQRVRNRPESRLHYSHSCICSDSSVGVEHDADLAAHVAWGQVVGELGLDETGVAVAAGDLAPDGLVVGTSLFVLSFVDIGDTLSVVESAGLGVVAALNLEESLLDNLPALSTLETNKGSFLVQSKANQLAPQT